MFIEERHLKIYEQVQEKGRVEVTELSGIFNVSEDSIRRDLRLMEKRGLIKRTYGGAIKADQAGQEIPYMERETIQTEIKRKLAQKAVSFIEDNDTILLDGSTTIAMMIPLLRKKQGLTIITNSVSIAYDFLSDSSDHKLFLTGGLLDCGSANLTGFESERFLQNLTVDKVFIGPCGITADWGLSASSIEEAHLKRMMIQSGKAVFIVADGSKLGQRFLAKVGPVKKQFTFIMENSTSLEARHELEKLMKTGAHVITAE